MIPILVTGGAGYIGSQTCKSLAKMGFLPIVYDNLSTGHAYAIKWGPFVKGDLLDTKKLIETIQKYKPKAILHFAADALVIESIQNPSKYYQNNVAGTLSLLQAMQKTGVSNLIFSSTCATYGSPQMTPITEDHLQAPINPYGRTKWMAEQMIQDFGNAYGIRSIFLRYFNAAGADLEMEIGENHTPETHLIPSVIQVAQGLKKQLTIYGTNFPTRDGSAIRDYIHVQDLAEAHVLALQYLFESKKSDVFNLGTGHGASVLEIIHQVQQLSGFPITIDFANPRAGEPAMLTAENKKAKEILGWEPLYSSLPMIIESAWKWHQFLSKNNEILQTFKQTCFTSPSL